MPLYNIQHEDVPWTCTVLPYDLGQLYDDGVGVSDVSDMKLI